VGGENILEQLSEKSQVRRAGEARERGRTNEEKKYVWRRAEGKLFRLPPDADGEKGLSTAQATDLPQYL